MSVFDKANLYAGPGSLSRGVNWFALLNPYDESIPACTVATPSPSGYEYVIASDISDASSPALIYSYVFGGVDQPSLYVGQIYVVDSYINNASEQLPELETPRCTNCNNSCRCIGADADSRLQSATVQFLKSGDYAALASWEFGLTSSGGLGTGVTYVALDLNQQAILSSDFGRSSGGSTLYNSLSMTNSTSSGDAGVWQLDGSDQYTYPYSSFFIVDIDSGASLQEVAHYGAAATPLSSRWGDYTTVTPDPANASQVWSLGSFLNGSGVQDQWWTPTVP